MAPLFLGPLGPPLPGLAGLVGGWFPLPPPPWSSLGVQDGVCTSLFGPGRPLGRPLEGADFPLPPGVDPGSKEDKIVLLLCPLPGSCLGFSRPGPGVLVGSGQAVP